MKEAEKKKSFGDYKICGDGLLCKTPMCVDFFVHSIHYIYCILYMREFRIFSPAGGGGGAVPKEIMIAKRGGGWGV